MLSLCVFMCVCVILTIAVEVGAAAGGIRLFAMVQALAIAEFW